MEASGSGSFPLYQNRGNDFMDGFRQRNGFSFFTFVHLLYQKAYRLVGNFVNLLSHSTDGNDGLRRNGGVVKADNAEIIR